MKIEEFGDLSEYFENQELVLKILEVMILILFLMV